MKKIALMCYFQKAWYNLADHLAHCLAAGLWDVLVALLRSLLYSFVSDLFSCSCSLPAPKAIPVSQTASSGGDAAQESGNGDKGRQRDHTDPGRVCEPTHPQMCCHSLCFKPHEVITECSIPPGKTGREGAGSFIWRCLWCFISHSPGVVLHGKFCHLVCGGGFL